MRWTERQCAMLREMGVQLWSREPALVEDGPPAADPASRAIPAPSTLQMSTRADVDHRVAEPRPAAAMPPAAPALAGAMQPADWLVIGEPLDPGDRQQEQLLDNLLRAIGASRTAPTRANRAAFVALGGRTAAAGSGPADSGDNALVSAAIAAAAPRCAIALGRAAAATLLGRDEPIGAWRGRSHRHGVVPVVVTFSLAFLLRHPAEKAKAWLDLCLAVGARAPTS